MFSNFFKKLAGNSKSISTTELESVLKDRSIVLLDVRTPDEYAGGHIRNARNFPLGQIKDYKGDKNKKHYVICQSGMRSKNAAKALDQMGYDVTNVKGGMNAWTGPVK